MSKLRGVKATGQGRGTLADPKLANIRNFSKSEKEI